MTHLKKIVNINSHFFFKLADIIVSLLEKCFDLLIETLQKMASFINRYKCG